MRALSPLISTLILLSACGRFGAATDVAPAQSIQIQVEQTAIVAGSAVRVQFAKAADSRCPLDAVCITAGAAVIDLVLAHPQWRGHIDATQIGGFGASMGGETMMLLGGAGLTSSLPVLSWNPVTLDPRIKASVGYVPHGASPRC